MDDIIIPVIYRHQEQIMLTQEDLEHFCEYTVSDDFHFCEIGHLAKPSWKHLAMDFINEYTDYEACHLSDETIEAVAKAIQHYYENIYKSEV